MDVIRRFDPWKGELCTCPDKYSFNPYTGCGHGCIYCYATYVPDFYRQRRKKNLLRRVKKDLTRIPPSSIVSISNSSDPYTPMDREFEDTRRCLNLFRGHELRILLITKSDLVLRDLDLLQELDSAVTITLTTMKKDVYNRLEPNAPEPERRLKAIKKLGKAGIPTGLRLDPIFPYLNDDEIGRIVGKASEAGVEHIVSSTFKPKYDGWRRFEKAFPETAKKQKKLYFEEGKRIGNSWHLPRELRKKLMFKVREECLGYGIPFATCREGLEMRTSKSCDGSHLIKSEV